MTCLRIDRFRDLPGTFKNQGDGMNYVVTGGQNGPARPRDRDQFNVVLTGDGVNFELPMEERDERLRPNFRNLQHARSQSAILSWNHVSPSNVVVQTAAYQRWSTVRQSPETIDPYGAQATRNALSRRWASRAT